MLVEDKMDFLNSCIDALYAGWGVAYAGHLREHTKGKDVRSKELDQDLLNFSDALETKEKLTHPLYNTIFNLGYISFKEQFFSNR